MSAEMYKWIRCGNWWIKPPRMPGRGVIHYKRGIGFQLITYRPTGSFELGIEKLRRSTRTRKTLKECVELFRKDHT